MLSVAAFQLPEQSWVDVKETMRSTKPKVFTTCMWPFIGNGSWSLVHYWVQCKQSCITYCIHEVILVCKHQKANKKRREKDTSYKIRSLQYGSPRVSNLAAKHCHQEHSFFFPFCSDTFCEACPHCPRMAVTSVPVLDVKWNDNM